MVLHLGRVLQADVDAALIVEVVHFINYEPTPEPLVFVLAYGLTIIMIIRRSNNGVFWPRINDFEFSLFLAFIALILRKKQLEGLVVVAL